MRPDHTAAGPDMRVMSGSSKRSHRLGTMESVVSFYVALYLTVQLIKSSGDASVWCAVEVADTYSSATWHFRHQMPIRISASD